MSPRPRTTTDEQVFAAVSAAVVDHGPAGLTLAAVGERCGLSAAALVQRFGSKRGLLLACAADRAGKVGARFAAARASEASPLLALVEALALEVREAGSPEALANTLAARHGELADGEFHALELAAARERTERVRVLLEEAMRAGEIVPADAAGLARTVQTTYRGALATWAVQREGGAEDWLRDELEAVLAPYLAP